MYADTVRCSMPRDGYGVVTLPNDLLEQLDDRPEHSRAAAVRALLKSADPNHAPSKVHVVAMDHDVIADIATASARRTADELEGRLR